MSKVLYTTNKYAELWELADSKEKAMEDSEQNSVIYISEAVRSTPTTLVCGYDLLEKMEEQFIDGYAVEDVEGFLTDNKAVTDESVNMLNEAVTDVVLKWLKDRNIEFPVWYNVDTDNISEVKV